MKFDVVVGNPPFDHAKKSTRNNKTKPIYPHFYDLAKTVAERYCLISPAKFLSDAGDTKKSWNRSMRSDPHIVKLLHKQSSADIFPRTDIAGGIVVLYRNKAQNLGGGIGDFYPVPEVETVMDKVKLHTKSFMNDLVTPRGLYKFTDKLYQDFPEKTAKRLSPTIATNDVKNFLDVAVFLEKPKDSKNYIKLIGRTDNRVTSYIAEEYIQVRPEYKQWRVLFPKANGTKDGPRLLNPQIIDPDTCFTDSYLTLTGCKSKQEAENLLKYVKTKFARILLGILKTTQDATRDKWAKVPQQDFSVRSDIDWSKSVSEIDQQLYQKYKLTQDEIQFIERELKSLE